MMLISLLPENGWKRVIKPVVILKRGGSAADSADWLEKGGDDVWLSEGY